MPTDDQMFYNGGTIADVSRPQKHLQMVPPPLESNEPSSAVRRGSVELQQSAECCPVDCLG